jgi:hypothetical protein
LAAPQQREQAEGCVNDVVLFVFPLSLGLVASFPCAALGHFAVGREMFTTDDILSVPWTVFSPRCILL